MSIFTSKNQMLFSFFVAFFLEISTAKLFVRYRHVVALAFCPFFVFTRHVVLQPPLLYVSNWSVMHFTVSVRHFVLYALKSVNYF